MAESSLFELSGRLPLEDADISYLPTFVNPDLGQVYLSALLEEIDWEQHYVRIAGKTIASPRLSSWHGDPGASYRYSSQSYQPKPWTPTLSKLREQLVHFARFNSVLVNRYRHGLDSMGWHSDDEKELGPNPVIASLSFGAEREFQLKHKRRALRSKILLQHGSLLLMQGGTQHHWQHAMFKSTTLTAERINLTFRVIGVPHTLTD